MIEKISLTKTTDNKIMVKWLSGFGVFKILGFFDTEEEALKEYDFVNTIIKNY